MEVLVEEVNGQDTRLLTGRLDVYKRQLLLSGYCPLLCFL